MTSPEARWTRSEGDSWDIVSSVGFTALGVAAMRAIETQRPDALAHDYFAEHFVRAAGEPHLLELLEDPNSLGHSSFGPHRNMGLRTRFFDEFFLTTAQAGVRQSVILATGLDSRAYRLNWPEGHCVFEIDQQQVLSFKTTVLQALGAQPTTECREVAVDLREDWPSTLQEAGFHSALPTAWSVEGLLPYLPGSAQELLFERIVELSAPGSHIAVESYRGTFDPDAFRATEQKYAIEDRGPFSRVDISGLFYTEERADPLDWLQQRHWEIRNRSLLDLCENYGVQLPELPPELREMAEKMRYFVATLPGKK